MPRRPLALVGAESSGRITAIEIARAQLFDVDADRKRPIDDAIDYFGGGFEGNDAGVQGRAAIAGEELGMIVHCRCRRDSTSPAGGRRTWKPPAQIQSLSNSDPTSEPERTILRRTARRASQSLEMVPEQRARRIWPYLLLYTWETTNGNRSSSSPHPKQAQ